MIFRRLKIKWLIFSITLIIFMLSMPACTERQKKSIKHLKSDIIGIERKVTLYDCNGNVIRNWEGRFKIEIQGSYLSFIDDNGKDIKVSGTVVVEET